MQRLKHRCATCGKSFDRPRSWAYCSKKCQHNRLGWLKRTGRPRVAEKSSEPTEYLALQARLESAHQLDKPAILRRMYQIKPPNEWVGQLVSQLAAALDQIRSMAPDLLPLCVERLQAHLDKRRSQLPQPTTPQ